MKTYIFSNCKKSDNRIYAANLLKNVPKDAFLVNLNRGNVYYQIPEFKNYPNQTFICRQYFTYGVDGYFGLDSICSYAAVRHYDKIYLFNPDAMSGKTAKLIIGYRDGHTENKVIDTPWMEEYFNKTGGKISTTGYAAYYLVQQLLGIKPEDITLVNFYGNSDNSTNKYIGHNWDFEDKWLQDKQRLFI